HRYLHSFPTRRSSDLAIDPPTSTLHRNRASSRPAWQAAARPPASAQLEPPGSRVRRTALSAQPCASSRFNHLRIRAGKPGEIGGLAPCLLPNLTRRMRRCSPPQRGTRGAARRPIMNSAEPATHEPSLVSRVLAEGYGWLRFPEPLEEEFRSNYERT